MDKFQKLIMPGLLLAAVLVIFFLYFVPSGELGSFSKFDTNSHASLPIIVKYVKERGAVSDGAGGTIFYVRDADNTVMKVQASQLPPGMDMAAALKITGHLTREHFHAHAVEIMN